MPDVLQASEQDSAGDVVPAVAVAEDFEDTTYVTTISGTWSRTNTQFDTGAWSFKSGTITHSQTTDAVLDVPDNVRSVRFRYKVSSESGFDFFRFLIDASEKLAASGEVGWTQSATFELGDASTITFRYSKDSSESQGSDAAYVDNVVFSALGQIGQTTEQDSAGDVTPPQLAEDFEDTTYVTTISGTWSRTNTQFDTGAWSFKSGTITHSQTTDAVLDVPSGARSVQFRYSVSSESGFDFFRFLIDASEKFVASGIVGWTRSAVYDLNGASTITFRYSKDSSESQGSDAAYVDNVVFFGDFSTGVAIGQATETDSAHAITPTQSITIDLAVESDSAGSITPVQLVLIERAAEVDTAGAITPTQLVLIDQASEVDSAGDIAPAQLVLIDQASEADSAAAISPTQLVAIDQAIELDGAGSITPTQLVLISQASEADSAGVIAPTQLVLIGQAVELDTGALISALQIVAIDQASESDSALALTVAEAVTHGSMTPAVRQIQTMRPVVRRTATMTGV